MKEVIRKTEQFDGRTRQETTDAEVHTQEIPAVGRGVVIEADKVQEFETGRDSFLFNKHKTLEIDLPIKTVEQAQITRTKETDVDKDIVPFVKDKR